MYILSKGQVLACGRVPFEPNYREFDWGVSCNFGINVESTKDADGKWEHKKMNIATVGELANIAKNIQKGDTVLCAGKMQSRKYTKDGEEKEIKEMKCEFISVMAKASNTVSSTPKNTSTSVPDINISADDDEDMDVPF